MSEKEFAVIVGRTKKVVLSAIRENLPARFSHAIDDIVQETYLRGYRALVKGSFRNEASLETWLFTIARNETYRASERLAREERKAEKAAGIVFLKGEDDGKEISESIENAASLIEKLPEAQRDVFRLILGGRSEKEIAHVLGIPAGTVKSRVSRGRVELRRLREEEMYGK